MNNSTAHAAFAAGITGGVSAVQPATLTQNGGSSTDGGHELIIVQRKPDRFHGKGTGFHGFHTAQSTGQDDHVHIRQIHFLQSNVRLNADAVGTLYDSSSDTHILHGDLRPPEYITGGNGLGLFKALSQHNIYHYNISFTA